MAESLGSAVLTLSVDDTSLKAGLAAARKSVEQSSISIKITTSGAEQRLQQLSASAKTLEAQLKKLQSIPLNLNTRQLARLGGDFAAAGKELNDYTRAVINGNKPLANNIAGLQQQSLAFRTLAANVKIGSTEFINFTQAAAKASQKQLFAGFEQAAAQQKLFAQGRGQGGFDSFRGTEELLAFASKIGKTPAAIALYTQALEQARDVTKVTDSNFAKLTAEIERQTQALRAAFTAARNYNNALGSGRPALPPAKGPAPFSLQPTTPEELEAAARAARRQSKIDARIDYRSTGGRETSRDLFNNALARPNPEAVRAEQALQKERLKTADITLRSARADRTAGERAGAGRLGRAAGIASNALIGGAFPLLFGQGLGASAGGALGGGLGGALGGQFGFGLSLVGTALGSQFDLLLQKSQALAKALDDPIGSFSDLVAASNLSSKGLENYIKQLIDLGQTAQAEALIRQDLSRTVDPTTLAYAAAANEKYARTVADVQESLGALLAGPASRFISWLEDVIKRVALIPNSNQTPEGRRRLGTAQQGAGLALGLTGIGIAGLGLLAAPLTGGASLLPAAIAGGALAAGGAFQTQAGVSTQEQASLAEALKNTQNAILEIEQKRVAVQKQLLNASSGTSNERAELQLKVDLLDVEAKRKKAAADFITRDYSEASLQGYKLELEALKLTEEQIRKNDELRRKSSAANAGLEAAQNALKSQSIAEQVRNTQALAAAEKGVERQTLATVQAIQTGINEAKRREQELGAQIDAARLRGGDAGEIEASRLVEQQKLAANETRLELEKGALALKEAGEQLRDNIRSAVVEVTRVRSDPNGLNRFLNPQQIDQRNRTDFQLLLPSFRDSQRRFTQLTGARAPEFSGPAASVNQAIRDFIQAVDREFDTTKDLNASLRAAGDINRQLVNVNTQLAQVTQALAEKNWAVNVAVQGGQAAAYGDVLNGALSS